MEKRCWIKIFLNIMPTLFIIWGLSRCLSGKNPFANAVDTGDLGFIPGLGRPSGGGNSNPLQYSCLGNSMDRGTWWATVHGVSKSQT